MTTAWAPCASRVRASVFSRISGDLVTLDDATALVETGGIAYSIILPGSVAQKLREGHPKKITLEIYASLAIEGNSGRFAFYGFTNAIEREFFEALLSVASIGPRSAARAFSAPMSRIARAIDEADLTFLKTLPGIGQQKAKDIVAKLQGKVTRFLLIQDAKEGPAQPIPDFAAEALEVLLQLEYKRAEAESMIKATLEAHPAIANAETLLAEIYRRKKTAAVS